MKGEFKAVVVEKEEREEEEEEEEEKHKPKHEQQQQKGRTRGTRTKIVSTVPVIRLVSKYCTGPLLVSPSQSAHEGSHHGAPIDSRTLIDRSSKYVRQSKRSSGQETRSRACCFPLPTANTSCQRKPLGGGHPLVVHCTMLHYNKKAR